MMRKPITSARKRAMPLMRSMLRRQGAPWRERLTALRNMTRTIAAVQQQRRSPDDPLVRARQRLSDSVRLIELENEVRREIRQIVESVTQPGEQG
jgi:hypothetical protein